MLNVVNDPGFQIMHWHEDMPFICVLAGEIEAATLEKCFFLHPNEDVFINRNVAHLVRKI